MVAKFSHGTSQLDILLLLSLEAGIVGRHARGKTHWSGFPRDFKDFLIDFVSNRLVLLRVSGPISRLVSPPLFLCSVLKCNPKLFAKVSAVSAHHGHPFGKASVRRQNLLDKLAMELREDLVHLS